MAIEQPITFSGTLSFPVDDGTPNCDVGVTLSAVFQHKADYKFEFTSAGNKDIDFGTLALNGAKVLLIEVYPDSSGAALPVVLTVNGGTDTWQLSPGGALLYLNPNPAAGGILSANLAWTSAATVRLRVFG
jgi:hypothetical protein